MARRDRVIIVGLSLVVVLLVITPADEMVSQEIQQVFVTNFPDVFSVRGKLTVEGAVHLAETRSFEDILVPPVRPTETTRLIEAGTLETEGFPGVVLSLHGITRGDVKRAGAVGAILIPDEQRIQDGFHELGLMPFSLETSAAGVSAETPYFASSQPRFDVAFPRYKVLLYNTTDKTVTVNLYAYLTN
jgi:hypothetical protein